MAKSILLHDATDNHPIDVDVDIIGIVEKSSDKDNDTKTNVFLKTPVQSTNDEDDAIYMIIVNESVEKIHQMKNEK